MWSRPSSPFPALWARLERRLYGTSPEELEAFLGQLATGLTERTPAALAAVLRAGKGLHRSPLFFSFSRALQGEPAAPVVLCALGSLVLGGAVLDAPGRALLGIGGLFFDLSAGGVPVDWREVAAETTGTRPEGAPRELSEAGVAARLLASLRYGAWGRGDEALVGLLDRLEEEID